MQVVLNGEPKELGAGATVTDVLAIVGRDAAGRGVAVAVNGEVVPRVQWGDRVLGEQDRIEVLDAVGGG